MLVYNRGKFNVSWKVISWSICPLTFWWVLECLSDTRPLQMPTNEKNLSGPWLWPIAFYGLNNFLCLFPINVFHSKQIIVTLFQELYQQQRKLTVIRYCNKFWNKMVFRGVGGVMKHHKMQRNYFKPFPREILTFCPMFCIVSGILHQYTLLINLILLKFLI